jgi:hypothetical protein
LCSGTHKRHDIAPSVCQSLVSLVSLELHLNLYSSFGLHSVCTAPCEKSTLVRSNVASPQIASCLEMLKIVSIYIGRFPRSVGSRSQCSSICSMLGRYAVTAALLPLCASRIEERSSKAIVRFACRAHSQPHPHPNHFAALAVKCAIAYDTVCHISVDLLKRFSYD